MRIEKVRKLSPDTDFKLNYYLVYELADELHLMTAELNPFTIESQQTRYARYARDLG